MLQQYCKAMRIPCFDLPGLVFEAGIRLPRIIPASAEGLLKSTGYCYCGWRVWTSILEQVDLQTTRNILLVRDPRDRLVSLYFSAAQSHTVPKRGEGMQHLQSVRQEALDTDINSWAQTKLPWVMNVLSSYHRHLPPESTRIYRYEDIVLRKEEWLLDIIGHYQFPLDREVAAKVATDNDILPKQENPNAHIRQVKPGNYRKHLSEDTITCLNDSFANILDVYGYRKPHSFGERLVYAHEGNMAKAVLGRQLF